MQYGKNIPENEILKVILKQSSNLPKPYIKHIKKIMTEQITELLLELEEREYDLIYTNVIFVGGGAMAVKMITTKQWEEIKGRINLFQKCRRIKYFI